MTQNDLNRCMKISSKLILDSQLTNWEFIVSSMILDLAGDNTQLVINKGVICATYCMGDAKRSIKDNIYKALDGLTNKRLITPIHMLKSDMGIYDLTILQDYSEIYKGYVKISYDEFRRICSYNAASHRDKLLRYFAYIVMHFNSNNDLPDKYRGKYGFRQMRVINEDFHVSNDNRTWIIQVNNILKDLNLLYIQNSNGYVQRSTINTTYRPPNIYCRYEDAAGALDYAVKYAGWNISIKMNIDADDVEEYIPFDEKK